MSQNSRVPYVNHRDDSKIDFKSLSKDVKEDNHVPNKTDKVTAEEEKSQNQSQRSKVQFANLGHRGSKSSQILKPTTNTKSINLLSKLSKISKATKKSNLAKGRASKGNNKVTPSKSISASSLRDEEGQVINFHIPPYSPSFTEDEDGRRLSENNSLVSSIRNAYNLACFPPIPGIPIGLEPLVDIESIFIQKRKEPIEISLAVEVSSKYDVLNRSGERIYFAGENFHCCTWNCLAQNRPFVLHLFDCNGKIVLTVERKRNSRICCWGSRVAGSEVTIRLGKEAHEDILGEVKQQFHPTCLTYKVYKGPPSKSSMVMSINGPCLGAECYFWITCCRSDFPFTINYVDEETKEKTDKAAGSIYKNYFTKGYTSTAHTFGLEFVHSDLDPTLKAILLGAAFCFNCSYYEDDGCCNSSVWFWLWIIVVLGTIIGVLVFFKVFRFLFSSNPE